MKRATINDAPAVLNINDRAMWVLGFNAAIEAAGQQPEPVAVRYRNGSGRWRYLNLPFTKGWTFPPNLGTPETLCLCPTAKEVPHAD